jgi:threonine/homoserine/homoserine lactone efflux protein
MPLPTVEVLVPFFAASVALNLTPGPDMTFVATVAGAQGRRHGLVAALGIFLGCSLHILLAVAGLSSLLVRSQLLFDGLRYVGALYLAAVAFGLLRRGASGTAAAAERGSPRGLAVLRRGFLVNALNPKVGLFFVAFLPQFVDASRGEPWVQLLLLGAIFNINGTIVNALVASGVGHAAARARRIRGLATSARWLSASLLFGFAARLVWSEARP